MFAIVQTAREYLGTPYHADFNCLHFVRAVYHRHELTVPPFERNIRADQLDHPPLGHVLFLRHRKYHENRRWTHATIIATENTVVHCSFYFGGCVTLTTFQELFTVYEIAR